MAPPRGSDSSFAFLCFGLVSCILFLSLVGPIFRFLLMLRSPARTREELLRWWRWLLWLPGVVLALSKKPKVVKGSLELLAERKTMTRRVVGRQLFQHLFKPRIILVVLFFFLFSIVAYQKLSFDPHAILGLTRDATPKDIKSAYRKLSMRNHPDKNKTAEARELYPQIKRAYKALSSEEAYDEEVHKDESAGVGGVGIALPEFLMDQSNRKKAMPVLLLLVFCLPMWLLMKLRSDSDLNFVLKLMDRVLWIQEEYIHVYFKLGDLENRDADTPQRWVESYDADKYNVCLYFLILYNEYFRNEIAIPFDRWRVSSDLKPSAVAAFNKCVTQIGQLFKAHQNIQDRITTIRTSAECGTRPSNNMFSQLQASYFALQKAMDELAQLRDGIEQMARADDGSGYVPVQTAPAARPGVKAGATARPGRR